MICWIIWKKRRIRIISIITVLLSTVTLFYPGSIDLPTFRTNPTILIFHFYLQNFLFGKYAKNEKLSRPRVLTPEKISYFLNLIPNFLRTYHILVPLSEDTQDFDSVLYNNFDRKHLIQVCRLFYQNL